MEAFRTSAATLAFRPLDYYFVGMALAMTDITADWIKGVRHNLGLTQEQFASRLGVSQGTVAMWENGDRNPSGSARILLEMLGLEADRLVAKK